MDESFDIYDDIAAEKKDDDIYGDLPTQKQTFQESSHSPERDQRENTPEEDTDSSYRNRSSHSYQSSTNFNQTNFYLKDEPSFDQNTGAIYVGNLTWWTTDQDLEDIFTPFGRIKNLRFFEEKVNGKSKGFALIEFQLPDSAISARDKINSREIHGRPCLVELVSSSALKQLNRTGTFQTSSTSSSSIKKKDNSGIKGKEEGMGYGGRGDSTSGPPRRGPPYDSRHPAPHLNPAFFRDRDRDRDYDRDREDRYRRDDYYRERERDYSPDRRKRSRSRSRDREDRYRRDRDDKDDYKRHRDSGTSRRH